MYGPAGARASAGITASGASVGTAGARACVRTAGSAASATSARHVDSRCGLLSISIMAERQWDCCGAFLMSPERLETEISAGSGAEERRSLSVMMPSSYSCGHSDTDEHHTTVDTVIRVLRGTVRLWARAGGGLVSCAFHSCLLRHLV